MSITGESPKRQRDKSYREKVRDSGVMFKKVMVLRTESEKFDEVSAPFRERASKIYQERTGGPAPQRNSKGKFAPKREAE